MKGIPGARGAKESTATLGDSIALSEASVQDSQEDKLVEKGGKRTSSGLVRGNAGKYEVAKGLVTEE